MNRKLMIGCGVGCGLLALIFAILVGGGAWFARNMNREYKVVQDSEETLIKAHGGLADWSPPAGLVPPPERLAAFVAVREATGEWRQRLGEATTRFAADRTASRGIRGLIRTIRSGSELAPLYAGFWNTRNEALIAQGMGAGEYAWLYGLVYYAWLGHDAAAGADEVELQGGSSGALRVEVSVGEEEQEDTPRRVRRQAHKLLAPLLAGATGDPAGVTAGEVADEQERMDLDVRRVPWQSDLPAVLGEAFEPHRLALEASWSAVVNPVELIFDAENWSPDDDRE